MCVFSIPNILRYKKNVQIKLNINNKNTAKDNYENTQSISFVS